MLRKIKILNLKKSKKWKYIYIYIYILWEKSAWIALRGIAPGSFKIPLLCILYTAGLNLPKIYIYIYTDGLIGGQLFGGGLDSKGY